MIDAVLYRKGNLLLPFSEDDQSEIRKVAETRPLRVKIWGDFDPRSLRELRGYWGSCGFIADLAINYNMNTKAKVDHLTRLKLGFVEGTVFDHRGLLHWIVKSLSFDNCHQPDAHQFITKAFEEHAALAGVFDVETYLKGLKIK